MTQNEKWLPTWLKNVDVKAIQKEINEAVAKILNKHGFEYDPQEITLNYLTKTEDPFYSALGVLHYPMIEQWCDEIRQRLKEMSERKDEILGFLCSIEQHSKGKPEK